MEKELLKAIVDAGNAVHEKFPRSKYTEEEEKSPELEAYSKAWDEAEKFLNDNP